MATPRALLSRFWESLTDGRALEAADVNKAERAPELNAAISRLWQAEGTHSKKAFQQQIVPIYTALHEELEAHQSAEAAEAGILALLEQTAAACHYRWSVRLPMKRPGSDYRKYEIIYTYALLTAMAVQCLREVADSVSLEDLAARILPEAGRAKLQADPVVWDDWLGYFRQADIGGLYGVSICAPSVKRSPRAAVRKSPTARRPANPPPVGSGRAMLEAIRRALADGSLSFNQPGDAVQVDRQGRTFLEQPKILNWCIDQLALGDDLKRVKGRFSRLKVHKRSEKGHQLYYGRRGKHDRRRLGYVLENPAVLWSAAAPAGQFEIEQVTGRQN
ncbi:MAG: hypothetical protein ACJAYC_002696 [Halieaceae bacterium]|jgi:hypothetical protein